MKGRFGRISGEMPLYDRVRLSLRELIIDGTYAKGTLVPGEKELASIFGVATITCKRALNELAREGLVERRRGLGTRVVFEPTNLHMIGRLDLAVYQLYVQSWNQENEILEYAPVFPPDDVAAFFDISVKARVYRVLVRRQRNGRAISYGRVYFPHRIGKTLSPEQLAQKPPLALLQEAGQIIEGWRETISARPAPPEVAAALDVEEGSPLIVRTARIANEAGQGIEFTEICSPWDQFSYEVDLGNDRQLGRANSPI